MTQTKQSSDVTGAEVPIVGFMPTAFTVAGAIDQPQMSALARVMASHGIRPAVLGGMGEFYALDRDESRACMDAAVDGADGVPVVAGVGFSTREAVAIAEHARDAGVSLLVVNPHYYAVPTPAGLAEHVRRVTDACGLPAVMYSSATHPMTDDHVEELARVPGFHGVKEEAYGPEMVQRRRARWGDRVEWWGVGERGGCDYVEAGAGVVTSSMANVSPGTSVDYVRTRLDAGSAAAGRSVEFASAWDAYLSQASEGTPGALKAMTHALYGWREDVRAPMLPAGEATRQAARAFLARFADLVMNPGA